MIAVIHVRVQICILVGKQVEFNWKKELLA